MQESKQVNTQQRRPGNRTRRKYVQSTKENNGVMPTEYLLRGEDDTAVIHEACYPGNCTVLYSLYCTYVQSSLIQPEEQVETELDSMILSVILGISMGGRLHCRWWLVGTLPRGCWQHCQNSGGVGPSGGHGDCPGRGAPCWEIHLARCHKATLQRATLIIPSLWLIM